jgi:hypothetical protein
MYALKDGKICYIPNNKAKQPKAEAKQPKAEAKQPKK